jgi:hypothetical protein
MASKASTGSNNITCFKCGVVPKDINLLSAQTLES